MIRIERFNILIQFLRCKKKIYPREALWFPIRFPNLQIIHNFFTSMQNGLLYSVHKMKSNSEHLPLFIIGPTRSSGKRMTCIKSL